MNRPAPTGTSTDAATGSAPSGGELGSEAAVLSDVARVALNVRLAAGLCTLLVLTPDAAPAAHYVTVVAVMSWSLWLLLSWERVGRVLVRHPAALAVDVLLAHFGLAVVGAATPFFFVVAGSAVLCGLCLGVRGALWFASVFLGLWLLALALNPPRTGDGSLTNLVVVNHVFVQGALFAGVAVRRLLLLLLENQRRERRESLLNAAAAERARLARELHDSVAKSLYGISLASDALALWIDRDPVAARALADRLGGSARHAVEESRRILRAMRADCLDEPFPATLDRVVQDWQEHDGRAVEVVGTVAVQLSPTARYEVLAIVAECLENVARHAPAARRVQLELGGGDGWIEVAVQDDGPGHVPADLTALQRDGHYGVVGMHERAARLGGALTVASAPGQGTRVYARLPVPTADEDTPGPPGRAPGIKLPGLAGLPGSLGRQTEAAR